jgi:hypothetical protein
MGVLKGLKSINDYNKGVEDRRQAAENRVKAEWFGLSDGEAAKVRFLQELDEESKNHSEKNGVGFIAVEHTSPADYRRKAACTIDSGGCYACDQFKAAQTKEERSGWKQKTRLYINVLVDDGVKAPYVAILSQGTGPKSVTPTLIDFANESESITNRWFKIKRTGSGLSDTSHSMIPFDAKNDLPSIEDYEVYDLEKSAIRTVPLAEQAAFYSGTNATNVRQEASTDSASVVW